MEDRKLYHLINGEFVHDGMPEVQIPTYAEIGARIATLNDIGFFDNRIVAESVTFDGISNGKRTTEKQASLFDAIHAEMLGEKELRAEKFRKTHDMRKKSKDDTPADRKRNKIRRIRKMYGVCFEDGYAWYWENGKDGQKKSTEPDAEIFRNRKHDVRERSLRGDWDAEIEDIIEDLDCAFIDAEYLNEQIGMLERNGLQNGDNYPRWNRLYERLHVVNEVIRKNRFVEEMLNDEFGFQNMTKEDCDND